MISSMDDTIAALATAPGKGAIAIIRMSGSKSLPVLEKIFSTGQAVKDIHDSLMTLGRIVYPDSGQTLDEVLVTIFRNPRSFTGEDVVEISCHGGPAVIREILNLLFENGVRLADPGEFTKRAFINGKMDLLQAEAVADIIESQTRYSLKQSQNQMFGRLSKRLLLLKQTLKKQLSLLEVELDFSEEDIEFVSRKELKESIHLLIDQVEELLKSFKFGKVIREGARLVLVGRPNVGKSSILNRLVEEDRAIVTAEPGTTRDLIEEAIDIDGVYFKVTDTAGLRLTEDKVEKIGVTKAKNVLSTADIIALIVESGETLTAEDETALRILQSVNNQAVLFLLINKIDLQKNKIKMINDAMFKRSLEISAKTGEGFTDLKQALVGLVVGSNIQSDFAFINKARHSDALRRAKAALKHAENSLREELSSEFVSLDVREALDALGELTGEVTTDEILNDIFSSFCIGK